MGEESRERRGGGEEKHAWCGDSSLMPAQRCWLGWGSCLHTKPDPPLPGNDQHRHWLDPQTVSRSVRVLRHAFHRCVTIVLSARTRISCMRDCHLYDSQGKPCHIQCSPPSSNPLKTCLIRKNATSFSIHINLYKSRTQIIVQVTTILELSISQLIKQI